MQVAKLSGNNWNIHHTFNFDGMTIVPEETYHRLMDLYADGKLPKAGDDDMNLYTPEAFSERDDYPEMALIVASYVADEFSEADFVEKYS